MLSRKLFSANLVLALILSAVATTFGQLGTAGISGQVLDTNGAAVPSARVVVKNKATGQARETTTSGEGTYTFQNLPPATYEIRIEAINFAQAVVETVTLNVGEVPAINVTLSPAGAQASVVITPSDVLNVDTNTSQVAGVINERTLANLPLNGRNFLDLAFLIPGNAPAPNYDPTKTTTIEVSSAGQLGRGGNIAVDGADNNDDVVGGTLQNFPQDGIGEFQIVTNRFSAEVGRSASSAINIVTKSGGNDFHGAGAFYYRNSRLSAVLPTLDRGLVQTEGRPPFDREQYAASIGGPIKRDRAWFFAAFEYRNQDGVVITGVRDLVGRRVITSFSAAPLNDLLFTGRGDWQTGKNDRMAFRYSDQREDDVDRGSLRRPIGTGDNRQHSFNRYHSFVYNWTHTFSPTVLNDFVFHENNFLNRIPSFVENKNEIRFPSVQDGGNFRIPQQTPQNRVQFRDNLSWAAGAHALKFGGEFQRIDAGAVFDLFGSGTIETTEDFAARDRNGDGQVNDNDIVIADTIRSAAPVRPPTVDDLDNYYFAFYAQDDWKVRPNFTLNLGLRWEVDTDAKNLKHFNEINPILLPFVGSSRSREYNNFAPRIGFNWDPWRNGRTSIRGGYGIYYDRIVLEVPLLERLLDGRKLGIEVRLGSVLDAAGNFVPGTPTLANPFIGTAISGVGIGINILDKNLSTPYVQQFNVGFQRELTRDLILSADYIHSFGSKFIIGRFIGSVFNPSIGGNDDVVNIESSVKTWYDGLLVNAQKRFGDRYSFNASYTLQKSFNFSNDDQIPFQVPPLNPNNLRLDKGPPPNEERHRFTFHAVVDMPYGFQLSPIYTLASDVPFDIQLPPDIGGTRIPQLQRNAGGRTFRTGSELNTFINEFNTTRPVASRLPLVRDDLKLGDSFQSLDLRLTKTFRFSEHFNIQGIAEVFNLFNITNVRGVNNVNFSGFQNTLLRDSANSADPGFLRSSRFGSAIQTAGGVFGTGGPRAFQFAVRVNY
jgi:carboxypeptidase family protein/TonB-dependent receptor-like protein